MASQEREAAEISTASVSTYGNISACIKKVLIAFTYTNEANLEHEAVQARFYGRKNKVPKHTNLYKLVDRRFKRWKVVWERHRSRIESVLLS